MSPKNPTNPQVSQTGKNPLWHWHHKHPVEFSKNNHTPTTTHTQATAGATPPHYASRAASSSSLANFPKSFPTRTLSHLKWSKREGIWQTGRRHRLRDATRPAPAGLTTLADPFRNHKSAWTLIAVRVDLRSCTSKRNPQARLTRFRCPAGREKGTCLDRPTSNRPVRAVRLLPSAWTGQLNGRMSLAYSADGLLAMLAPVWQVVIGGCVLVVVIAASARLARRGRSRMTTALLVTGAAAIGLAVIGVLASRY
jgi:hypothetical protein